MKTIILVLALSIVAAATVFSADDPFATAQSALAQNQLETAEAVLTPLAAAEKPDPRACLFLSQVRLRQARTKEAVALAEKAVAAAPNQAGLHSFLGSVLAQRISEVNFVHQALIAGRMLEAFQRSIELDPKHLDGYVGLARYYANAPAIAGGGREPAERYARELEKHDATRGRRERAQIAERFDDPAAAYVLYHELAGEAPNDAGLQESMGRVSEAMGKPQDARSYYEKALALDPARSSVKEALNRLATAKS